jgi:hypothetical protein
MKTISASIVVGRFTKAAYRGRFFMPRESYLPKEARGKEPIVPEGTDLAIWPYEMEGGRFYAIGFVAKQSKPLFHFNFRSEASRDQYIQKVIADRKVTLEFKEKRQQERREFKHEFNVGDILDASWGYDQTNVNFYEVTKILGSQMIELREIAQKEVKSDSGADYVIAVPGKYISPPLRKRVSLGHGVRIDSSIYASKWDGKPKYQTSSGWGH